MSALDDYAEAVVRGDVPAGRYHKLACRRHLDDRARESTSEFPYRFDLARAERFFRFSGKLKHYKGEWAGRLIVLEAWQQFITGSLFGWVHVETSLRRYRTVFIEVPRKNGKTLLAAIVLLYLTFFDGEAGAEGYSVANKRDQAKIVFRDCKQLVLSSGLKGRIRAMVSNLHRVETQSKLEPLGADHDSTDGLNPNVVCVDEMHAMKDRGMLDVMETAVDARLQPVIYEITTFGNDPVSVWGDQHDYAMKILSRALFDESFFVFSAHADKEDDWTSPLAAQKANPNYGVSVKPEGLALKVLKAKGIPKAAATYKQKHLNLLSDTYSPCLSVEGWRAGQTDWTAEDMKGERCFVGVDLASKLDLCSLSFVFPPKPERDSWRILQFIWTPKDTIEERSHRDRAPYEIWAEQGWLITQDGVELDHDAVRAVLVQHRELFQIVLIGFDPWHAHDVIQRLQKDDGFAPECVIEVPPTYRGLSHAESTFQAAVMAGRVDARRCPVTTWSASNVVSVPDGKDNILFSKKRSRGRIDPIKSATTGMSLALRGETKTEEPQLIILGAPRQ